MALLKSKLGQPSYVGASLVAAGYIICKHRAPVIVRTWINFRSGVGRGWGWRSNTYFFTNPDLIADSIRGNTFIHK